MKKPTFDEFYESLYSVRWHNIRDAMLQPPNYYTLSRGLTRDYFLDTASFIAADSLPLPDKGRILDLCAAPGGKALVLAGKMGTGCAITVNEKSPERRNRLKTVLDSHLPEKIFSRIRITGYDAAKWGLYEQDAYDAVLLDVPCSSERHILNSDKHLAKWSQARTKHLSIQAYAMLASALMTVKCGGYILYATCALSIHENDRVVEKLLKRKSEQCEIVPLPEGPGESTRTGVQILPDTAEGMGPLFYSLIQKLDVDS